MRFSIRVYGIPKGQPRPRARAFGGHASVYNPKTADEWKGKIIGEAFVARARIGTTIEEPVECNLVFLFPRPGRLNTKKAPEGRIPHTTKPDRDNCDKAVLDAMTTAKVWQDDCLVYAGSIQKFYVAKGEEPGCEIEIITKGES